MIAARRTLLHAVDNPPPQGPEDMLRLIVPELEHAERTVGELRRLMVDQARLLSRERGVAYTREERIRAEFGGSHAA